MTAETPCVEAPGEKLIRLWQESWQAELDLRQEIRERGTSQNFEALHAGWSLGSAIRELIGKQVIVQPVDEDHPLTIRSAKLHGLPNYPADTGPLKELEGEASGIVLPGSFTTGNYLLLKRISRRPLFRLPKTYEVEVLDPRTGEPQVEISVCDS